MADESGVEGKDYNPIMWALGGAVVVVTVLIAVWWALTFGVYPVSTEGKEGHPVAVTATEAAAARGQFGDMFGLANALFSGFAFTALIVSLQVQRKELALQRRELAMQREELRLSRGESAKQAQALERQALATKQQAEAMEKQAKAMGEQSETMQRQALIELLAARINAAGALLSASAGAMGNHAASNHLTQAKFSPYSESVRQYRDLLELAEVAKTTSALA